MATMQAKYGSPDDIETRPEWSILEKIQGRLLEQLGQLSGSPQEVLFETVQEAMFQTLGMDEEVVLSRDQAEEIVQLAVDLALLRESQTARQQGQLN